MLGGVPKKDFDVPRVTFSAKNLFPRLLKLLMFFGTLSETSSAGVVKSAFYVSRVKFRGNKFF